MMGCMSAMDTSHSMQLSSALQWCTYYLCDPLGTVMPLSQSCQKGLLQAAWIKEHWLLLWVCMHKATLLQGHTH